MRPRPPFVLAAALAALAAGCGGSGVHGTPGGPGLRDPYFPKAGNGGYDVRHYGLVLDYDPARRHLSGTATVTARATEALSAFDLDLDGLTVEEVTVDGRTARWSRAGQELTVRPRDGLRRGATFRVTVRYSGEPVTITDHDGSEEGWLHTADGAVGLGEPTGSMAWFPGNHHPSDKAAYDLTVTVPEGLRAVSNGELTSERTEGGRTTSTWHSAEPMPSHAATVAIGRFDVTRTTTRDGLPVLTAVDPEQAAAGKAVLGRVPEIMEWAGDLFGPYPFSSTGAIVDRPGDAGYALETQTRPYFAGAPDLRTLVHELAHQWYGNSVTPKTWADVWLAEGFATYAEWLWDEDHGGDSAQHTFDTFYATGEGLWAFPPAEPPDAAHLFESPVYQGGAMVLHRVRRTVGDDAFRALLRGWAAAHRHGNADTADFTAYVEKSAPGTDFTPLWREWLHGSGTPPRP
ncbi:M1 family metallopeptidase [Streptomyces sp. SCSIO 75703]|uniref:M1 family metallopeptidase n=1 Tax=unclassified Streptomyces TaxID=2593676 RepID=UPI0006B63325|nr:M1 family metallopeptidase [Streptomyces sp. TP-A0875]